MEFLAILAVLALFLSLLSLLISIGSAMRVQRLQRMFSPPDDGLKEGSIVPTDAIAPYLQGSLLEEWLAGPGLLILTSSTCQACRDLVQRLNGEDSVVAGLAVIVIEATTKDSQSLRELARFRASWYVDPEGRAAPAFQSQTYPHSFLVKSGRVVAKARGTDIEQLLVAARALETALVS